MSERYYLRVPDFELRQNPKRPKRPTWIKMFVRDLDDPQYTGLSLAVRGFLGDFHRLAADMENRVPYDVKFIARRLDTRPANVGQALHTCMVHGLLVRFAPPTKGNKNNDIEEKIATPSIPPSLSNSKSLSLPTVGKRPRKKEANGGRDQNTSIREQYESLCQEKGWT